MRRIRSTPRRHNTNKKEASNEKVATAEIAPNGKIVQFYADEDGEDVEYMKPTAEAQTVVDKWLKDFGKDAVKAMKKVA